MSVTIREIAKALNMSPSTVSQALNNKGSLRTQTRERVRLAARRMGYFAVNDPFGIDPTLSGRPVHLVVPGASNADELRKPSFSQFAKGAIKGIESALQPYKITPVYVAEGEVDQAVPNNLVATIMLGGYIKNSSIELLERLKTPVVSVASPVPSNRICSVAPDAVGAIRQAVDHLVQSGHKRIAFLNGPLTTPSNDHKLTGFVRAMYDHGLPVDEVWSVDNPFRGENKNRLIGRFLTEKSRHVTAVICAHGALAKLMIHIANKMGLHVPGGLSVVAFDEGGVSEEQGRVTPRGVPSDGESVTAFGVASETLGRYAVTLALSVRANSELVGTSLLVKTHLMSVGSSARIA